MEKIKSKGNSHHKVLFRMDETIYVKFRKLCDKELRSMQKQFEIIFKEYLDKREYMDKNIKSKSE